MTRRQFNQGASEILSWPLTQAQIDSLGNTLLVSPRPGNAHGYTKPSDAVYDEQIVEVEEVRNQVAGGRWPAEFMEKYTGYSRVAPLLAKYLGARTSNPQRAAELVRMDHPLEAWDRVIEPYFVAENVPFAVQPNHQGVPFVERVLARSQAHVLIAGALNRGFDVKCAFGACRPIEMRTCEIAQYETPCHASTPAGHSCFAGAAAAAGNVLYVPTIEQALQARLAMLQLGHLRTAAGMHYAIDNTMGIDIGWKYVYEMYPNVTLHKNLIVEGEQLYTAA